MVKFRTGHAKTLPRQREHVFRPFSVWLLHLDTPALKFFVFGLVFEASLRCREVKKFSACPALVKLGYLLALTGEPVLEVEDRVEDGVEDDGEDGPAARLHQQQVTRHLGQGQMAG